MPTLNDYSQPVLLAILGLFHASHDPNEPNSLTIAGQPPPVAASSTFYSFTPTVRQTRDGKLVFQIQNKPSWASFGKKHGTLYGVPQPANAGSYPGIVITVSDGKTTTQLRTFAIRVVVPSAPPVVAHAQ